MQLERLSGVLTHPTSFPSPYGIGDLGQGAYDFIDFLKEAKQAIWQVLPLNPTSFGDSPYQSFSTFAGNPLLISPDLLLEYGLLKQEDLNNIPEFDPTKISYGKVIDYKGSLLNLAYENFKTNKATEQKTEFDTFCNENSEWLDNYCLFVALKFYFIEIRANTFETDEYKQYTLQNKAFLLKEELDDSFYGGAWLSWPNDLAFAKNDALNIWTEKLKDEISYHKFLQFLFFKQWAKLKQYANNQNIKIIGDIPIFVALDSADVWSNKQLFLLNDKGYPSCVAGVPPDYFSETGQLWGNPIYNWDKNKSTGYNWWIKRIQSALSIADIIRIDHFRGFESYWSIPFGEKTAIKGEWIKGPGKDLFDAIKDELGVLPIIAEDLGILTPEVEELRDGLDLPGMKILQFGFDAGKDNVNMPHNFKSTNVVAYTGTHDNDTTLGWYEQANEPIRDQVRRYLNVSGENVAWDMIRFTFLTSALYAIVPIQDIMNLPTTQRMNYPGTSEGNWQFRYTKDMLQESYAQGLSYLSDLSDRNTLLFEVEKEIEELTEIEETEAEEKSI